MKAFVSVVLGGLLGVAGVSAQAADSYFGINYLSAKYEAYDIDLSPSLIYGRIGTNVNDHFSFEARAGFGASSDSQTFSDGYDTVKLTLDAENVLGIYGLLKFPVGKAVKPYLIFGYTDIKSDMEVSYEGYGSVSESTTDNDISYGLGIDISVSESTALNAEYMRYYEDDGADVTGFAAGAVFKF